MRYVSVNLNRKIRFRVTESGIDAMNARSGQDVKEGDVVELQLWEFCSVFGPELGFPTMHPPVDPCIEIEVEE